MPRRTLFSQRILQILHQGKGLRITGKAGATVELRLPAPEDGRFVIRASEPMPQR